MMQPTNSSNFSELEEQYSIIINNIINTFKFVTKGVIDSDDLRQEALMALHRASCQNTARPYIIRSIINAVWKAANKFKKPIIDKEKLQFNRNVDQPYTSSSSLDLNGLPIRAQKIIQMILGGQSKQEILNQLNIKHGTYQKLLARAKKKILE